MMVDLGGGTTDIAVISMGGIIVSTSLKVAGNSFDETIVKYIENTYKLAIGTTVGEELKKEIGCVFRPEADIKAMIRGRNLTNGIPEEITVSQTELCDVLRPLADEVVAGVKQVLAKTPPELSGDILTEGILMTGGTAQLRGLDGLIEDATGIRTTVARDPVSCVGIGTGQVLLADRRTEGRVRAGVGERIRVSLHSSSHRAANCLSKTGLPRPVSCVWNGYPTPRRMWVQGAGTLAPPGAEPGPSK